MLLEQETDRLKTELQFKERELAELRGKLLEYHFLEHDLRYRFLPVVVFLTRML